MHTVHPIRSTSIHVYSPLSCHPDRSFQSKPTDYQRSIPLLNENMTLDDSLTRPGVSYAMAPENQTIHTHGAPRFLYSV